MRFWDREREINDLKRFLRSEPNAILFVYGPKSSGKSTLLMRVMKELSEEPFEFYWYDLREELISGYESVLEVFFKERGWKKRMLEGISRMLRVNLAAFELDPSELSRVLARKENPFTRMRRELEKKIEEGKRPVIVFDELHRLKGVYMNSPNNQRSLIDELFNFFVRITKVLHLAHVLVMTSDTFFIEEVYSSSALKNTSRYYLVDYFDDETAFKILVYEGLSEENAKYVVDSIGGVPWIMEEVVKSEDPKDTVEEFCKQHRARLEDILAESYKSGMYEDAVRTIKKALEGSLDVIKDRQMIENLVERELLFFDPINRAVRFQTKLDEKAAREILKEESPA